MDIGCGMAGDTLKDIDQIVVGIDTVQAAGDDQTLHVAGERI
jgi:hypothetical protein